MSYAIPVIDLGRTGDRDVLEVVRAATEELGVVQVVGHGVPESLSGEFSERMARLLGLPRAEKARLASPTGHPYLGWRQWPDDFGRLELERFNVAQFDNAGDARAAGLPAEYAGLYAHSNVWPQDDPALRDVTFGYMEACRRLAERMLGLYARAQGLAEDTFPVGALPHFRLTVNDYPTWTYPGTEDETDGAKLLLLEHSDDSAITILAQEGVYEGLQIQAPDGTWLPVPVVPGALQVFSGNLLARWTAGRLRPGRHRVVAGGTGTRRSVAVFYYPALDTVVEPLAPFAGGGTSGFEPLLVWDHVKDRVRDYLAEFGRPDQVTAWRESRAYVAGLAENSAGR
ncbi:MAG: isopenicillin N synthase family oxygenase [Streptosporangiaceae bacterium]|nr:isopenicillin N synthase family oxygenase [Streptosporangiaceae bacterium]MBV9855625.1 isopenicillin N synthase family oxygenase [Streptosporangiaceae bacterium]